MACEDSRPTMNNQGTKAQRFLGTLFPGYFVVKVLNLGQGYPRLAKPAQVTPPRKGGGVDGPEGLRICTPFEAICAFSQEKKDCLFFMFYANCTNKREGVALPLANGRAAARPYRWRCAVRSEHMHVARALPWEMHGRAGARPYRRSRRQPWLALSAIFRFSPENPHPACGTPEQHPHRHSCFRLN
jgi:hypothetical protein